MSTSVSTIFDNLVSKVAGALPASYTRLPNPYIIDTNNQLYLKKGYGVAFGPGNRIDLHVGCLVSYERIFRIILTNEVTATEHNTAARASIETSLLEDFISMRIALEQDHTLSQSCIKMEYSADSGIEFNLSEQLKFITMSVDLICTYEETLT